MPNLFSLLLKIFIPIMCANCDARELPPMIEITPTPIARESLQLVSEISSPLESDYFEPTGGSYYNSYRGSLFWEGTYGFHEIRDGSIVSTISHDALRSITGIPYVDINKIVMNQVNGYTYLEVAIDWGIGNRSLVVLNGTTYIGVITGFEGLILSGFDYAEGTIFFSDIVDRDSDTRKSILYEIEGVEIKNRIEIGNKDTFIRGTHVSMDGVGYVRLYNRSTETTQIVTFKDGQIQDMNMAFFEGEFSPNVLTNQHTDAVFISTVFINSWETTLKHLRIYNDGVLSNEIDLLLEPYSLDSVSHRTYMDPYSDNIYVVEIDTNQYTQLDFNGVGFDVVDVFDFPRQYGGNPAFDRDVERDLHYHMYADNLELIQEGEVIESIPMCAYSSMNLLPDGDIIIHCPFSNTLRVYRWVATTDDRS